MSINQLLSKAILESRMPITRIADKAKISRQHIYAIMREEKNISAETLENICRALNISVSSLYEGKIEKAKGIKIPVLGVIHAGVPIEAVENIIDYEEISQDLAKTGDFFALKVKGNSMVPTLKDGDIVIVRKQPDADSGKICVVMINGNDATLKEIKKDANGIYIIPHNPDSEFKTTYYTAKEVQEIPVRILGVAIEIRRSL